MPTTTTDRYEVIGEICFANGVLHSRYTYGVYQTIEEAREAKRSARRDQDPNLDVRVRRVPPGAEPLGTYP